VLSVDVVTRCVPVPAAPVPTLTAAPLTCWTFTFCVPDGVIDAATGRGLAAETG